MLVGGSHMQGMGPLGCSTGPLSLSPKIHQQLQEVTDHINKNVCYELWLQMGLTQDAFISCKWNKDLMEI